MKKEGLNAYKLLTIILITLCWNTTSTLLNARNFTYPLNRTLDSSSLTTPENDKKKEKKVKDKPENRKRKSSKKITFESFDVNYQRAMKYYEKSQYLSAAKLFEELYPLSFGTPLADTILFSFANCYFQNRDYQMAAFHFKDYTRKYPGTTRTEDAAFKCVTSIYNLSPDYTLDQFETYYALDELNLFAQTYPRSVHKDECNRMLDELWDKLAKKDFEIFKLYYYTEHYQAAQIASRNFLREHSSSKYVDESLYILIQSNLKYAKKSIASKKRERFLQCIDAYETLMAHYPNSQYIEKSRTFVDEARKNLER